MPPRARGLGCRSRDRGAPSPRGEGAPLHPGGAPSRGCRGRGGAGYWKHPFTLGGCRGCTPRGGVAPGVQGAEGVRGGVLAVRRVVGGCRRPGALQDFGGFLGESEAAALMRDPALMRWLGEPRFVWRRCRARRCRVVEGPGFGIVVCGGECSVARQLVGEGLQQGSLGEGAVTQAGNFLPRGLLVPAFEPDAPRGGVTRPSPRLPLPVVCVRRSRSPRPSKAGAGSGVRSWFPTSRCGPPDRAGVGLRARVPNVRPARSTSS